MIRAFEQSDMDDVLDIWLKASIKAHSFVGKEFWESKIDDMRNIYIPNSDTYVFTEDRIIKGFFSLHDNTLAALFVSTNFQGRGIGRSLMEKAKALRKKLNLSVYRANQTAVRFYKASGFSIVKERIDEHTGNTEIIMEYIN